MQQTLDQEQCHAGTGCNEDGVTYHKDNEIFYKRISAFSVHTFAEDFSTLTTKLLDDKGKPIFVIAL